VTTWGAVDLLDSENPHNLGRPGIAGQRGANLAVQNSDLVLAVGTHLCVPMTGTLFKAFAREAKIVVVDIDPDEHEEFNVPVQIKVIADAKSVLERLDEKTRDLNIQSGSSWNALVAHYREHNEAPPAPPSDEPVHHYSFVSKIADLASASDTLVVDGGGTNVYVAYQAFRLKPGQRMILSTGLCSMGSGLPEAIGAAFAKPDGRILCFYGDGSFQLNIQELQTILHHRLPVKIFLFDNNGYLSIRHTQNEFLEGNLVGSTAEGGMSLPDYRKVA